MTPPKRQRRFPKEPLPPPPPPPRPGVKKNPERLFVVAGKDGAERAELDLVTLIVASAVPTPSSAPEQTALLRLCTTPLSVAELSAYLNLPFSAMTVLLTDMLTADLVTARAPLVRKSVADRSLLEAVMHGLQRL
ncbi:DUF742 domain-containing protein [Streptomyces sp. Marseille-Q5077]|uniref:DUF742 domain-containing protein n=1 Tax=Streptomyces sp. Marseille-Q5077 TaxID=3418995 RepID=UPI003CFF9E41